MTAAVSVSSSRNIDGSTPCRPSAARTSATTSEPTICCGDRLTLTGSDSPRARQRAACQAAASSTIAPIGTISPTVSA